MIIGMSKHKQLVGVIALMIVSWGVFTQGLGGVVGVEHAHAAPFFISGFLITSMQVLTSLIISIVNFLMWILFMILDLVMNPVWIFDLSANGADGSLVNMLREIWQLCRDLVNLGLALTLIFGAIMMIVTTDATKLKAMLPKVVAALVLVNFSWFLPRAIFDLSQILTYTVYQIPSLLSADGCVLPPRVGQAVGRPCEVVINYEFFSRTTLVAANGQNNNPGQNFGTIGWSCPLRPLVCIQSVPINSPAAEANAQMHSKVINGLIVNHARLRTLVNISDPRPGGVGPARPDAARATVETAIFLVKMVVVLLMHFALFFPILALTVAFFLRIPVLWVTMAFMPLAALGFVIGDKLGDMDPKKLFMDEFLKAVFLPAQVAIPFTIGFMMLNAAAAAAPPAQFNVFGPIALFQGVNSLWQIVWMIVAVFIIWKYSFQTLKKGPEMVNMFTDTIQSVGKASIESTVKYPLSIPFIPVPGAGTFSPLQLAQVTDPRRIASQINSGQRPQSIRKQLQEIEAARRAREGGGDVRPNDVRVNVVNNNFSTLAGPAQANVRAELVNVGNGATDDARRKALEEALKLYRAAPGAAAGENDTDTVEGLIRANPTLTPDQIRNIRAALAARRRETGRP